MRPTRLTIPVTVPELINLGRVARLLDLKRIELVDLTTRVDALYHRKVVPVGKKRRIIDIPYAELKVVQRSLHDNVFSKLAVADSVYSVGGRASSRTRSSISTTHTWRFLTSPIVSRQ